MTLPAPESESLKVPLNVSEVPPTLMTAEPDEPLMAIGPMLVQEPLALLRFVAVPFPIRMMFLFSRLVRAKS